jgi:hypothetical protein
MIFLFGVIYLLKAAGLCLTMVTGIIKYSITENAVRIVQTSMPTIGG